jgi:hypothetical protein
MKCFSLVEDKIIKGIPNSYTNTMTEATITDASVRFYICEQLGELIPKAAKTRYEDLFLYGYTELIPDNGPGNLFPEDSYLLDIAIADYIPGKSQNCMKIQTIENRVLLGCTKESIVATTKGTISWDNKPVLSKDLVINDNINAQQDVLILEL